MVALIEHGGGHGGVRPFQAHVRETSSRVVVEFTGDLDLVGWDVARAALDAAWATGATSLVIDLSEVDFMDSTGVMSLLAARATAATNGHGLSLRLGPAAARVMELCGVLCRFDVEP